MLRRRGVRPHPTRSVYRIRDNPQVAIAFQNDVRPIDSEFGGEYLGAPVIEQRYLVVLIPAKMASPEPRAKQRASRACVNCRQKRQRCNEGRPCVRCREKVLECAYDTNPSRTERYHGKINRQLRNLMQKQEALQLAMGNLEARLEHVEKRSSEWKTKIPASTALGHVRAHPLPTLLRLWTSADNPIFFWPAVLDMFYKEKIEAIGADVASSLGNRFAGTPSSVMHPSVHSEPIRQNQVFGTKRRPTTFGREQEKACLADCQFFEEVGHSEPNGHIFPGAAEASTLLSSYHRNIHLVYPFLDLEQLYSLCDRCLEQEKTTNRREGPVTLQLPHERHKAPGLDPYLEHEGPEIALVYLVLALGAICYHENTAHATDREDPCHCSMTPKQPPCHQNVHRSFSPFKAQDPHNGASSRMPGQLAPPRFAKSAFLGSQDQSQLPGVHHAPWLTTQQQSIPGMPFYDKACEILDMDAQNDQLVHAQAFLLAGMYMGQLTYIEDSMHWYAKAGIVTQSLMGRHHLYSDCRSSLGENLRQRFMKSQSNIKTSLHNLIVFASWTCLQLETNLPADSHVPSRNMKEVQHLIPMPLGQANTHHEISLSFEAIRVAEAPERALLHFTARSFLRRRLNMIRRQLFGASYIDRSVSWTQTTILNHAAVLEQWRRELPDFMDWRDEGPPSPDVLTAGLQAEYWGAICTINRPFLDYALHIWPRVQDTQNNGSPTIETLCKQRSQADIHLLEAIDLMEQSLIWKACRKFVEAALQHAMVLDAIQGRLSMPNFFGIVYTCVSRYNHSPSNILIFDRQFGNMWMLAATFEASHLRSLVEPTRLRSSLSSVVALLRGSLAISPFCCEGYSALDRLQQQLFAKET